MTFYTLFNASKPLIGVIHLPPLPGYDNHPGMEAVIEKALLDLRTLIAADFGGVLVENDGDNPPHFVPNKQISSSFGTVMKVLRANTKLPLGMEILYDMPGTIEVAALVDADFVRLDVFVDDVLHDRGPTIKAEAAKLNKLRHKLKPDLLLLTDVQVKHTAMLDSTKTITQSTQQAAEAGSDAVIVTGTWTGNEPNLTDLLEAKRVTKIPVLIGSGLSVGNAKLFLPHIDGAIVASSIKTGALVDPIKAKQLAVAFHDKSVVA